MIYRKPRYIVNNNNQNNFDYIFLELLHTFIDLK